MNQVITFPNLVPGFVFKEWYSRKADESATILAMTKNKQLPKKAAAKMAYFTKFFSSTLFDIEPKKRIVELNLQSKKIFNLIESIGTLC